MKYILFFLLIIIIISFSTNIVSAQSVGINNDGSKPNANAMLDVKASNKGILIPRTSTTSRTAIPDTKGLLMYDTTSNTFWYNDGASWQQILNGSYMEGDLDYVPKFYGINTIGNSRIFDNGSSVSVGNSNAWGANSFAEGNSSGATGIASVAMGYKATAGGDYSFASGNSSQATGTESVAMGYSSYAVGNFSFAAGSLCHANGSTSVAIGDNTTAGGFASMAMGDFTNAGGDYSFAMGISATASGALSVAMGTNIVASGSDSKIFGSNLFDAGHKGDVMLGDTDPWNAGSVGSGTDDQMICRFNNGYYFLTGGNTNRTGIYANHGDNSWSQISDSTKKEKIIPVDGEELLNKIAKFKLCTWNYKGQDPKTFRHYGPMAQDFHNAFGHDALGTIGNDTLINQADFLGVSFTAIQALEKRTEKIEQQQQQILELQKQNEKLSANNEKLQQQLQLVLSTVSILDKKVQALAIVPNNSNAVVKK